MDKKGLEETMDKKIPVFKMLLSAGPIKVVITIKRRKLEYSGFD